jgi:D-amino peptidase
MKIYMMTDLEGVAGVLNFRDWCGPRSPYYNVAKELLTSEVNAAADGLLAGGATEIVVADGHGAGAINPLLLDPRVELMRGWPTGWPLLLDDSYDAVAWVGQHAKACTEFAHLAHTQSFAYAELSINGVSIGEFGQLAMCASELGVRSIFGSGDRAFCAEAQALVPGIETVEVKRGTTPGRGEDLSKTDYGRRNLSAIHSHPERAREMIRAGAERAVRRAAEEDFGIVPLTPPFQRVTVLREDGEAPRRRSVDTHPDSVITAMNLPFDGKPV